MTTRPTSAESFRALMSTGKLRGKQREIATAVYVHGPGTSAEILQMSGALDRNRNLARARFTELRNAGILREDGARKCKVTGRTAIVWTFDPGQPPKRHVSLNDQLAAVRRERDYALSILSIILDEEAATGATLGVIRRFFAERKES